MPSSDFWIRVYDHDASIIGGGRGSMFQGQFANWTNRVKDLVFSTKSPGGFSECTFRLDAPYAEVADIYSSYHHYYVQIGDGGGEIVWEGRIETVMLEPWQATVTCYGLWSNSFDQFYNDGSLEPDTLAENPVSYLTDYVALDGTYQKLAQSFTITDARALQDAQIRLKRVGEPPGSINVEIRHTSQGGTLVDSNSILASNCSDVGFSEWIGVTTDARLNTGLTYYVVIYGDSEYMAGFDGSNYISVGRDNAGNYGGGSATYYDGGSWNALTGDLIFYIWPHAKFYCSDAVSSKTVISSIVSECDLIDNGTEFYLDDGITVSPIRFTNQEKHGDAIAKVITFGSSGSTPEPLFFGVYEDGVSHLRKHTEGQTWWIDVKSIPVGQQAVSIVSSLDGYRTRTAVLYSDQVGSRAITIWNVHQALYEYFGYHREGLYSISGATEATAESIANIIADIYTVPDQKLSLLVDGHVMTEAGAQVPNWRIRAGDIIKLRNLLPSGAVVSDEMVDRLETLYVMETSYDADSGRLTIVPTALTTALLDIILALAGYSGGSIQ